MDKKDGQPIALPRKRIAVGLCALAGMACAMAFVVSAEHYVGKSDPPASPTSLLWSALGLVFALLFHHLWVRNAWRVKAAHLVFGLLFGVVNYFGTSLFAYDTWGYLHTPLAWGKAILQCVGQGLPMTAALVWIDALLQERALTRRPGGGLVRFPRLRRFYREHTVLSCMALFLLCWSPYLVAFYPGSMSWDIGEMLAQFFGLREMDTWHPVFTTWLVGGCLWVGRLFHSDNLGAFLFTLLQTVALAYALGYGMKTLRQMGANRFAQGVALVFFALVPIWGAYAQFICKDTLYTATLLLFALQTMELLRGFPKPNKPFLCRYALWALLTCLLRSNGLYVVLPTAVLLVLAGIRGKTRLRVGAALGSAVVLAVLFSGVLLPLLNIRDETQSGLYSVCFQQSARVLRDHHQSVTPEEYAEIDLVLDAARLPELYEPWISDPVKYTFKPYGQGAQAEKAALQRYQKTWLAMLWKHPLSYAEAFVAGNSAYYAFTPKMEGETYNNQAGNRFVLETHPQVATNLDVHTAYVAALEKPRVLLAAVARGVRHIPLLSVLYGCAAYTWLLVAAGISVARQRRARDLVAFMPALFSLATCLLSPVNDYFRYFLPIVAMAIPLLLFSDRGRMETQEKE